MEEPKARSKSVSLLPDLWEKVEARAKAKYGGNRSSYLRDLVERDLSGDVIGSAFTGQQIDRWMDDEVALIEAGRRALTSIHGKTEQERTQAAKEMAEILLAATMRKPLAEHRAEQAKAGDTYGVRIRASGESGKNSASASKQKTA